MKRNFKRKVSIALLAMSMVLTTVPSAAYNKITEIKSAPEAYADGVTHENIRVFTDEGWINMNVLRIDLDKNVEMNVLTDTVLSSRDTLTNLVKKNNSDKTVVAAINSDFFDTNNSTTMGNLVKDNQLLSTSVGYADFASFSISSSGVPYVAYVNTPTNTVSNGTYTKKLSYINKPYLAYNRTIMFDKYFSPVSYGKYLGVDILEILVVNDVIKEIRRAGENFKMPENGYVLASVGTDIAEMSKNFKVGDVLSLKKDVNFRFVDLSIGGGAQLVKDGKVVSAFSQNITGLHPRTGLGITKDRNHLILVTIDGRTNSYRGVSQTEFANILIGLGAYEAINLDGGGSTQMVTTSPWTTQIKTMNYPSDKVERKMYTGLAIEKVLVDSPTLRATKINLSNSKMLIGSKVSVALNGSDTNYNPVTPKVSDVVWSVSGVTGTFENGYFIPSSAGKGIITAIYNGMSTTQSITVNNNGVKLVVSPSILKIDAGQEKTMTFSVITEEGNTIALSPQAVKSTVPTSIGTYDALKGTVKAGIEVTQGYMTFEFDGLVTYVPVGVGIDKQLYYDFETPTATFSGYPASVVGAYSETVNNAKFNKSAFMSYDFSKSTDTRAAYMIFNKPAILPVDTQGIGVWVNGDGGNSHWLRAKVIDSEGVATNITLASSVNWQGWKYVSADLPSGLKAPFTLERIYLVETEATKQDSGYIMFDNVEAITSDALTVSTPQEINRVKQALDYKLPADLANSPAQLTSYIYKADNSKTIDAIMKASKLTWSTNSGAFSIAEKSDAFVIKVNNKNGYIRKNDYSQWIKILDFVKKYEGKKPVVFMMNDVYIFNDSLELDLFMTQLQTISDKGKDVAVIFPTANATFNVGKTNGAYFIKVPKSSEKALYLNLGIKDGKIYFEAK
ncbi:phosphodiester glycosidase family protein [Fusibacter bizertensis]|uniref:Phosphodiester glycosidase family protein n=1 Tax=Fusibacter bizertensis TaxID=1488331 RepID=A0ABT6NBF5_9FIRM|nr:phosphodiester glycosidase family protein [Fusibacter bizertensis]MDH8677729.1 phosphodiester glycosidase family protein [Fusibacter bizertensis]